MEVSTTQSAVSDFSPASSGDALSLTTSAARRRTYVLLSIVGLGLALRFYGISLYPLGGDEYGSIAEAKSVGLNWNSILYSTLMHFWVRLGTTEFWLRLPAAIFGIATVPLLFRVGEKLGGWRTGLVAGLLAATSPFNIYHSQEIRFYSLFIFSSTAFMLATISYVEARRSPRARLAVAFAGGLLLISHFVAVIALFAQGSAAFVAAKKRRSPTVLVVTVGLPLLMFGLPILPPVRNELLHLYQVYGNAQGSDISPTSVSLISFAKIAFAGYTFVFGYHVYPFRAVLVVTGLLLCGFLVVRGAVMLAQQSKWRVLPFSYLVALIGIYLVLDSVGGRVASGVSPRHAAFVWPAFVVLVSLGLSCFKKRSFKVLLVALLLINSTSLWYGWQKDWSYVAAADYRSAAAYASRWNQEGTALLDWGRAADPIDFYFSVKIRRVDWYPFLETGDLAPLLPNRRLIVVTNDWQADERRGFDRLLQRLDKHYTGIDGRVDYPLFEYVFERTPGSGNSVYSANRATRQLPQPLSIYGLEFQDLRLPVTVTAKGSTLEVIGAYGLPNVEGQNSVGMPLSQPTGANKLILLTNVVGAPVAQSGAPIAEVIVESNSGVIKTLPLRLGVETASWDERCQPNANCETAFQWHKRMALVGQKSFPGGWRDFQAGLHLVTFDLPPGTEVTKISIRYSAGSGHLYLWGIALAA